MVYIIRANNKTYTVSPHAAMRMLQRYISEEMLVEALENGAIIEQEHGIDVYETRLFDEVLEQTVIVQVAVDEETETIVSVIDDTEGS
jgi:hypothetical protein